MKMTPQGYANTYYNSGPDEKVNPSQQFTPQQQQQQQPPVVVQPPHKSSSGLKNTLKHSAVGGFGFGAGQYLSVLLFTRTD